MRDQKLEQAQFPTRQVDSLAFNHNIDSLKVCFQERAIVNSQLTRVVRLIHSSD